jgi:hypothetical protein
MESLILSQFYLSESGILAIKGTFGYNTPTKQLVKEN